jgi:hypothetical protein
MAEGMAQNAPVSSKAQARTKAVPLGNIYK